jgi:hypothetical protein
MDDHDESRVVPVIEQDVFSDRESSHSTLIDAHVPVLAPALTLSHSTSSATERSIKALREQFSCTHALATAARKKREQVKVISYFSQFGGAVPSVGTEYE